MIANKEPRCKLTSIINELDLANALNAGHLHGAAIDVFESEPYTGPLADIERCILTSHMGSMTVDCRTRMEIEDMVWWALIFI